MQVRFTCPACGGTHWFDMPEMTIHMTCGRTGKALRLRMANTDVRATIVDEETGEPVEAAAEEET